VLAALALVGVVGVLVAQLWAAFKDKGKKQKLDALGELGSVVGAQKEKIDILETGLAACRSEHEQCQRKINAISAFNLRLQAREQRYQTTINRLEVRQGLEPTDFSDVSHAPEDSEFR